MKLCKHEPHKIIDWIKQPKWSTDSILINTRAITPDTEHYLIRFSDPTPWERYGWFYMSGDMIRKQHKKPNGRGEVYIVPLANREEFQPIKQCDHDN